MIERDNRRRLVNRRRLLAMTGGLASAGCLRFEADEPPDAGRSEDIPSTDTSDNTGNGDDGERSDTGRDEGDDGDPTPEELEPLEMTVAWSVALPESENRRKLLVDNDGLFVTGSSRLVRLDPETGDEIWSHRLDGSVHPRRDVLWSGPEREIVTVADEDGTVSVLDVVDGRSVWTHEVGVAESLAVTSSRDAVVVGWGASDTDGDAGIECFERDDGTRRWQLTKDDIAAVDRIGDAVLMGTLAPPYDGYLEIGTWNGGFAVDLSDGSVREDFLGFRHRPLLDGNNLYHRTGGVLRRYEVPDRTQVWQAEPLGRVSTQPRLHDDRVFFGGDDHGIYGFDAATGDRQWRYQADGEIRAVSGIVDGTLWAVSGGETRRLIAVDATDGTPRGVYEFDDERVRAVDAAGRLVVRTDEGVYSLSE